MPPTQFPGLRACVRHLTGLLVLSVLAVSGGVAQPTGSPVRVSIRDEQKTSEAIEPVLPVDPQRRVQIGNGFGNGDDMAWGLAINGQRLCYNPQGGIGTTFRIDGQVLYPAGGVGSWELRRQALAPSR